MADKDIIRRLRAENEALKDILALKKEQAKYWKSECEKLRDYIKNDLSRD